MLMHVVVAKCVYTSAQFNFGEVGKICGGTGQPKIEQRGQPEIEPGTNWHLHS